MGTKLEDITNEQVRNYILCLIETKKYSESFQNQTINALKIYFENILSQEIEKIKSPLDDLDI